MVAKLVIIISLDRPPGHPPYTLSILDFWRHPVRNMDYSKVSKERLRVGLECGPAQPSLFSLTFGPGDLFSFFVEAKLAIVFTDLFLLSPT